ncbi:MAG: hypothetical protein GWO40_00520, partial [Gammaproteobacteria bacterium]|nr:hypothetical protein [Gammaproteobacteria bacterium]NIX84068.1 hypothetical protein [Gammaproteobacteria bacterium]
MLDARHRAWAGRDPGAARTRNGKGPPGAGAVGRRRAGRRVLVPVLLLVTGCAGPPRAAPERGPVEALRARVAYVDAERRPAAYVQVPAEVVLFFPPVRGAIFGAPRGEPVLVRRLHEERELEIDLREEGRRLVEAAEPLRETRMTE